MRKISRRSKLAVGLVALVAAAGAAVFGGVVQAAAPGAPTNNGPPIILGSYQEGSQLSVLNGSWTGSPFSFSYQWMTCDVSPPSCAPIPGAQNATYTVQGSDVGNEIFVQVIATNGSGQSDPVDSAHTGPVVAAGAPVNNTAPTITGASPPVQGQALTAQPGTWDNLTTIAYQWLRCDTSGQNCVAIAGATSTTYTPVAADAGNTLRVLANATSTGPPAGGAAAVSAATAALAAPGPNNTAKPTITGTATLGQTLTAGNGTWTSPNGSTITYAYQWQRCNAQGQNCVNIPGATLQTYQLQQADVGSTIHVVVTATNNQGSASATSSATTVVGGGGPSGTTIPVSQVSLPNRLVVTGVQYTPSVLRSRAPFQARFRIGDTQGHFVSGAEVSINAVPFGRVAPAGTVLTDQNGFATFNLQPTAKFPLIKGYLITVFVRAVKPGDSIIAGVTAQRLTSVRINPR